MFKIVNTIDDVKEFYKENKDKKFIRVTFNANVELLHKNENKYEVILSNEQFEKFFSAYEYLSNYFKIGISNLLSYDNYIKILTYEEIEEIIKSLPDEVLSKKYLIITKVKESFFNDSLVYDDSNFISEVLTGKLKDSFIQDSDLDTKCYYRTYNSDIIAFEFVNDITESKKSVFSGYNFFGNEV